MIRFLFEISLLILIACILGKKENFKSEEERKKIIKYCCIATLVFFIIFNFQSCFNNKSINNINNRLIKIENDVNELKQKEEKSNTKEEVEQREISKEENYDGITDIKEENIMSGDGSTFIGKCGTAKFNKDKITEESLIKFYNEKIKDSGYNGYTLINESDETKGMVFSACLSSFVYGDIDKSYGITNGVADGTIENNKVEYKNREVKEQEESQNTKNVQQTNNSEQNVENTSSVQNDVQQIQNEIGNVIVTDKGKRYHKSGCRTLKKSTTQRSITVQEAENEGYTPCGVCGG